MNKQSRKATEKWTEHLKTEMEELERARDVKMS